MANVEITGESNVSGVVGADLAKVNQQINQVSKAGQDASSGGLNALMGAFSALGGVAALAGVVAATERLYELGAAANEAASTLSALTQGNAPAYIDAITQASDGMISRMDATTIANKAVNAGFFTSTQQLANVTTAAAQLADVMGVDTVEAENLLIDAIDKGNMRLLAQAGIVEKGKDAQAAINALMDADPRLDATSAAQLAAYNAVMERSNQLTALGVGEQRSAGDSTERLASSWQNLTTAIGQNVSDGLQPAVDWLTAVVDQQVASQDAMRAEREEILRTSSSREEANRLLGQSKLNYEQFISTDAAFIAEHEKAVQAQQNFIASLDSMAVSSREAEAAQQAQVASIDGMIQKTTELSAAIDQYNAETDLQAAGVLNLLQNQGQLNDAWSAGQNAIAQSNLSMTEKLNLYQQLGLATGELTTAMIAQANAQQSLDNLMISGLITTTQYSEAVKSIQVGLDASAVSHQTHLDAVNNLAATLMSQGIPLTQAYAQAQKDVTAAETGHKTSMQELQTMITNYNTALSQMQQPSKIEFLANDQVTPALETIRKGISDFSITKYDPALLNADITGAERGVKEAQRLLDSMKDKTITVTVILNDQTGGGTGGGGGGPTPKAVGGPVFAGEGYIVGEKGPEFFMPGSDGTIIPNHQISNMAGPSGGSTGSGGGSVFYITLPGVTNAAQMFDEVIREGEMRGLKFAGVA